MCRIKSLKIPIFASFLRGKDDMFIGQMPGPSFDQISQSRSRHTKHGNTNYLVRICREPIFCPAGDLASFHESPRIQSTRSTTIWHLAPFFRAQPFLFI